MRLPLPLENTFPALVAVVCAPGTMLTGASLTAVSVMVRLVVVLTRLPALVAAKVTVRVEVFGASLVLL
jgi:hypothetical protein